jgi:ABC-type glycerol-3-phosphate transport system substrate-binding protein
VAGARALIVTPNAKDKDAAFQVISTVVSDAVQEEASRLGTMSPLKSLEVQKTFGSKLPFLNGKNIPAVYQLKPAWRKISDYDDVANKIVTDHFKDINQGKDINTIIRETEEAINQTIAAELAK